MALCSRVLRLNVRKKTHRMLSTEATETAYASDKPELSEEEIESKRTIHRLKERTYLRRVKREYCAGLLHDFSVKNLRRDFINFGAASGINPGVCWPNKEEIADLKMIEKKFYKTFDQLKQDLDEKRSAEQKAFVDRETTLEENLQKLKRWREEMLEREKKVRQKEEEKKAKMDELIREVREHIGYNVDPSDPRFQEVMEMKEAERKQAQKEARRIAKKEKMMQRLMTVPKMTEPIAVTSSTAETQQSASETPSTDATTSEGKSKANDGESK